jgi:quinol monooxygenase YgiN
MIPLPLLTTSALALCLLTPNLPAPPRGQDDHPIAAQVAATVADPAKPFVMVLRLKTMAGEGDALVQAFKPAITATLKEKGCIRYELARDPKAPDHFVLYEKWASLNDLRAHLAAPHIAKLLETAGPLFAADPDISILVPVAD